jgi:hypothetical protein
LATSTAARDESGKWTAGGGSSAPSKPGPGPTHRRELTGLAKRIAFSNLAEGATAGELLWSKDPDAPANMAMSYDLNTVTDRMMAQAARQIYQLTQNSLAAKGYGPDDPITVHRAGGLDDETVSASMAKDAARFFARGTENFSTYVVPRSAILMDMNAVLGSNQPFPGEEEVMIHAEDLRNAG